MKIKFEELVNFRYKYIFEYYDMPLFFILESPSNELYLNYMIDEIDNNIYKWFFSRITRFELNDLLNQTIGVKSFLLKLINEKRMNYLITNNSIEELDFKLVKKIQNEELPIEDYTVEYDFVRNKLIESQEKNIKIESNEFDLILRDVNNSHLIEANVLVNVLGKMQNLYASVSQGLSNLKVSAIYQSSFGMKLVGEEDLLNTSKKTLESILTLFQNVKELDFDKIEENINIDKLYDLQAINKAKELAYDIDRYNISLEIKPEKDDNHRYFIEKTDKNKFKELNNFIEKINPEKITEITVQGMLNSINMNYNNFTIIDDNNNKLSGKIDSELKKDIINKQFVIPASIEADLDKIEEYNYERDEYITRYVMKNYRQTIKRTFDNNS